MTITGASFVKSKFSGMKNRKKILLINVDFSIMSSYFEISFKPW